MSQKTLILIITKPIVAHAHTGKFLQMIHVKIWQIVHISAQQGGENQKNIVAPGMDAKNRCQAKTATSGK